MMYRAGGKEVHTIRYQACTVRENFDLGFVRNVRDRRKM